MMSTTTTQTKTTLFTNVQQDWPSFKFRPYDIYVLRVSLAEAKPITF